MQLLGRKIVSATCNVSFNGVVMAIHTQLSLRDSRVTIVGTVKPPRQRTLGSGMAGCTATAFQIATKNLCMRTRQSSRRENLGSPRSAESDKHDGDRRQETKADRRAPAIGP